MPYEGYDAHKAPSGFSGHVAAQLEFRERVLRHGRPFRTGQPFLFATKHENEGTVRNTKTCLRDYLRARVIPLPSSRQGAGEMVMI